MTEDKHPLAGAVKPLVWIILEGGWLRAGTPWGAFLVCNQTMFGSPWRSFSPSGWATYPGDSAEEVVEKIEADYTARILAAIDPEAVQALIGAVYDNAAESALEFFKGLGGDDEWWPGDLKDNIIMATPEAATAALARIRTDARRDVWQEVLTWMNGIANPTLAQSSQAMARNYAERIRAILATAEKEHVLKQLSDLGQGWDADEKERRDE